MPMAHNLYNNSLTLLRHGATAPPCNDIVKKRKGSRKMDDFVIMLYILVCFVIFGVLMMFLIRYEIDQPINMINKDLSNKIKTL